MQWVTRDFVHLDRVASPWLILRFVDPQAEFVFVPWGKESERPTEATPFGMPGVELGPHDAQGTTFQKILRKHGLEGDKALARMGAVIARGVDYTLHGFRPAPEDADGQIAVGLLAVSEGLILRAASDAEVIATSLPVYDALYASFKVHAAMHDGGLKPPAPTRPGPGEKIGFMRALLRA